MTNAESENEKMFNQAMTILGELIINKVKENVRDMDLISKSGGGGAYLQGWLSKWDSGSETLLIENTQEYSDYLEYGTYSYWSQYGLENFPSIPIKKKDVPASIRKKMSKGMMPFAPARRVIYNDAIMDDLIQTAFDSSI